MKFLRDKKINLAKQFLSFQLLKLKNIHWSHNTKFEFQLCDHKNGGVQKVYRHFSTVSLSLSDGTSVRYFI